MDKLKTALGSMIIVTTMCSLLVGLINFIIELFK